MDITWNVEKGEKLRLDKSRGGITFDDIEKALSEGKLINDIPNPSRNHKGQRLFVVDINNYAYIVPYFKTKDKIFLKTVYPSRKYTQIYLQGGNEND